MSKKAISTPNTIVHQLIARLGEEEFSLPEATGELWDIVENSEVYACLYHIKAGLAYKALKAQLPHGEYEKELKHRGIPQQRAQERIAVADLVLNCPALNHRTSGDLEQPVVTLDSFNFSQLNELTRLPEEKIQTLEPEELAELSKLPVRALKATVKQYNLDFDQEHKLEAENANLKKRIEETELRLAETTNELGNERLKTAPETLYGLPYLVGLVRQEAPQISQQLHEHGLQAVNLVEQLIVPGLEEKQAKMAASALYHWLAGPMMQISVALGRLEDHFGPEVINEDAGLPTYGEDEWEAAESRRQAIVSFHRDAFKPKKQRGRK